MKCWKLLIEAILSWPQIPASRKWHCHHLSGTGQPHGLAVRAHETLVNEQQRMRKAMPRAGFWEGEIPNLDDGSMP